MTVTFETDPRSFALEMVEQGLVSADHLLLCALKYMSHDDVRGMLDANELSPRFDEDGEEEEKLFSAGWNVPGCLPEMDPESFDDFDDAKQFIISQLKAEENSVESEELAESFCSVAEDINLTSDEFVSEKVGDYVYWVERV